MLCLKHKKQIFITLFIKKWLSLVKDLSRFFSFRCPDEKALSSLQRWIGDQEKKLKAPTRNPQPRAITSSALRVANSLVLKTDSMIFCTNGTRVFPPIISTAVMLILRRCALDFSIESCRRCSISLQYFRR